METIPLFPLGSVLFPHGRMGLQIFEARYIDLISDCMKNDKQFGVVLIREGLEVVIPEVDSSINPTFAPIGTLAKIVDWDQLSNGLLGVTIEGEKKFRLLSSYQEKNHLHMAEVEFLPAEPNAPLPEEAHSLDGLLNELVQHPHVAKLNINPDIDDVSVLSSIIAQLLPIDEGIKFALLAESDPHRRLHQLISMLEGYAPE